MTRKEFDIFAIMEPAKEVAGDFYDFFFIDEDNFCIVISDVSGKGVPSALFMVIAKTLLQAEAQRGTAIKDVLFNVNNALSRNNETSMFATLFCGVINLKSGELRMVNAGHNPPIIGSDVDGYNYIELNHNIALGVLDNFEFKAPEFTMKNINIINNNYKQEILLNLDKNGKKMFQKYLNIIQKLLDEHVIIIKKLKKYINEYNLIENKVMTNIDKTQFITLGQINEYINIEKDQMFFDKILPIIKEDEANLNEILIILIDEYLK